PGGYQEKRTPVLRLGRVLNASEKSVTTDCTLVGGDSGGPLFDLDGKVIGIHSRIGPSIAFNVHVPVSTYADTWERLAASETWGSMFGGSTPPKAASTLKIDGLTYEKTGLRMKVVDVAKDSLAE